LPENAAYFATGAGVRLFKFCQVFYRHFLIVGGIRKFYGLYVSKSDTASPDE
jgi:hypothetical protein